MPLDFLSHYASSLKSWLDDPDVIEISVNGDGGIWLEQVGDLSMVNTGQTMDADILGNLGSFIAGKADLKLGETTPLASAVFEHDDKPLRAQVVINPAVRGMGALSIRKYAVNRVGLESFAMLEGADQSEEKRRRALFGKIAATFKRPDDPATVEEMTDLIISNRLNVLISGGTSSGKTTFLRAMLDRVPVDERIITIEDVPEIHATQPNKVELICERAENSPRTPEKLLETSLRLRPDRVLVGELRGAEARMYLEAINTGHPGSISTMHANSAQSALQRLSLMVRRGGGSLSGIEVREYVAETIDLIIQLDGRMRKGGISGYLFPGEPYTTANMPGR